jgi:hypothetical protein
MLRIKHILKMITFPERFPWERPGKTESYPVVMDPKMCIYCFPTGSSRVYCGKLGELLRVNRAMVRFHLFFSQFSV